MNGKQAKKLRKIARTLKLPVSRLYEPMGALRRLPARFYKDRETGEERVIPGGVLRRPFALKACERRSYQEAKAIYKGGEFDLGAAPELEIAPERPFRDTVIDSIKVQPAEPTFGPKTQD